MLTNHDIVCLSSIDWDFVWQGHQEIMATLAQHGNRVLFVENTGVRPPGLRDVGRLTKRLRNWWRGTKGFRKEQDNVFVYSPIILPFPYSRLARWINRWLLLRAIKRWMRAVEFHDPIIWTFLPTGTALDLITHLDHQLAVYYCIANFEQLVKHPKKIRRTEEAVVRQCDLVFAQGEALRERCRQWNEAVYIFPFGVNLEVFQNGTDASSPLPEDLRHVPRPIVGYVGGLHQHVDLELLRRLAGQDGAWSLALVGPIQTNVSPLAGYRNVFFLGQKPFTELPRYIEHFDVAVIPYVDSEYTRTVYPTKLNEYHALGKPVVSTALPEVVAFNARYGPLVRIASDHDHFVEQVHLALQERDPQLVAHRMAVAREHGWAERIQQMSQVILEHLQRKSHTIPNTWTERLMAIYYRTKRRVVTAATVFLVAYAVLFKSPLIWWLAEPLKAVASPRPAEAIVVFGGGVGESGLAGQGHEERVAHAVHLYQSGYAPRLIFSSGYVRVFREAEVMRALTVSLGVPGDAMVLEELASNTYENVRFVSQILRDQQISSILLVSSPYHMRRAMSVFRRQAPEVTVIPTPVSGSRFYAHTWGATPNQLKGIVHEYLALLWYWLRGWI